MAISSWDKLTKHCSKDNYLLCTGCNGLQQLSHHDTQQLILVEQQPQYSKNLEYTYSQLNSWSNERKRGEDNSSKWNEIIQMKKTSC